MESRRTGFEAEQSVSPVAVAASFVTAPISPAVISEASSCFLPRRQKSLPIFSFVSLFALYTLESDLIVPEYTRNIEIFPTNGSATVLNTKAESGAFSLGSISISSPVFASFAATFPLSAGDGKYLVIASKTEETPRFAIAEPPNTGTIVPLLTPLLTAV